jgi:hypothetical protein
MKSIFTYLFCLIGLSVYSQGQGPDVILIGIGNRQVEPSYRIAENPKIIDTSIVSNVVEYPMMVLQYPTSIELDRINPATIKTEGKLAQLYQTYVKLGLGTELMPLGEAYFDSKRSRKFLYGAHAKHLSSFGNFKNYAPAQFDRTKVGLYGALNETKYSVRGNLHYNNEGFHYYGLKVPTDSVSKREIAQRFQDFGGTATYFAHPKDSTAFNYSAGIEYNYFTSKKPEIEGVKKWRATENYFALLGSAQYRFGKDVLFVDLNLRHNSYKYGNTSDTNTNIYDTGLALQNTVIQLKPSFSTRFFNNKFSANFGLNLIVDAHSKTKGYLFPLAELKYSMFNDIFIPYVGLRGDVKQRTFRSFTSENEFILPNVSLRNEINTFDFYIGFKGTLSKRMTFNASASFARVKDKGLFVSDTLFSPGNKFNIIYDTLNLTTIEGSLSYQMNEKLKIDGIARYFSYDLFSNAYAWNLPQWQAIIRGSYNLYDKFLVNLDINLEGGRKALVYALEDDVKEENMQFAKDLGLIADINLGLEYRYNKRLSVFVQLNNVASQRYMRWYNYPVQIFQFLGGVTARF